MVPHKAPAKMPATNRAPRVRAKAGEAATTRLSTTHPERAMTMSRRRGQPIVLLMIEIAPTIDPSA